LIYAEEYAQQSGKTDFAVETYSSFAKLLSESKDERFQKMAKMMENSVRRLTLVGKPVKVEGDMLDGKTLDWSKYAGKVVIVDFWASWCGPCLRELPIVKTIYEKYHERGLEIVGISLDRNRKDLDAYLKASPIPWTIVYNDDGSAPTANYYGVMTIPAMFLVGKDGKVISTTLRGDQIHDELEKLLGKEVAEKKSQ
jgi:thiol-disulfide isomerase/thioredoxin